MKLEDIRKASAKLAAPFPEDEIHWRVQNSRVNGQGEPQIKVVPYLDAKQVEQRLDDVLTVARWTVSYQQIEGGFLATIGVFFGDPVGWVYRTDGAEETNIESTKGGISDAFKRAAVKYGVGRYLYVPAQRWNSDYLGIVTDKGKYNAKINSAGKNIWIEWNPPKLRTPTSSYITGKPVKGVTDKEIANVFDGKEVVKIEDPLKEPKKELEIF